MNMHFQNLIGPLQFHINRKQCGLYKTINANPNIRFIETKFNNTCNENIQDTKYVLFLQKMFFFFAFTE